MIMCRIEANVTFKKSKGDLIKKSWKEGENGNTDNLYWLNGKVYEPLTGAVWKTIEGGAAKL